MQRGRGGARWNLLIGLLNFNGWAERQSRKRIARICKGAVDSLIHVTSHPSSRPQFDRPLVTDQVVYFYNRLIELSIIHFTSHYEQLLGAWRCPTYLLNIAKRSLPELILSGVGLASNDAVG